MPGPLAVQAFSTGRAAASRAWAGEEHGLCLPRWDRLSCTTPGRNWHVHELLFWELQMASLQQNTVFKYWHENPGEEINAQHTPNTNSSALTGPVPLLPETLIPQGTTSGTKPAHCPFAMDRQAYIETRRGKNPQLPTVTKQVITFHLITKYFADGATITCGEREQSIFLPVDSMSWSPQDGWELPFLSTHHPLQPHLQHHFNSTSVLQGWQ